MLPKPASPLEGQKLQHFQRTTLVPTTFFATMMTKTVLALLIVCAMLVADSDCWRRKKVKKFFRKVGRFAREVATQVVSGAIVNKVSRGRKGRDALCADQLTAEQVQQLTSDLQNTCANIPVNFATDGLNLDEVKDLFTDSDVDGDGTLLAAELADFSDAIQTTESCAEMEAEAQK